MRILIADDESATRRIVETLLTKTGHEVVVAHNGAQAWDILQQPNAPGLAILDWMMPGLDGLKVCRNVRALKDGAYFYLIIVSAKGQSRDVAAAINAGADDYLSKPFDPEELHARVCAGERVLRLHAELRARSHCARCSAALRPRAA
jgi:sigma-B regulation protein RsbU (phosphoserine phosphatase)